VADLQPQVQGQPVAAPVQAHLADLLDPRQPVVERGAVDEQLLGGRLDVPGQVEKGLQGLQELAPLVVLRDLVEGRVQQVQDRRPDAATGLRATSWPPGRATRAATASRWSAR
jgi:hypothetical protein